MNAPGRRKASPGRSMHDQSGKTNPSAADRKMIRTRPLMQAQAWIPAELDTFNRISIWRCLLFSDFF